MHAQNVVHRDIKMDNIMCLPQENEDDLIRVKVMDFGFAHFFKGREEQSVNLWPGTPAYMAPELYKKEKYGVKVDVWAVGVLIYTLMARDFPFRTQPGDRTPKASVCDKEPNWNALEDISKDGIDFLKKCLDKDKNSRPDVLTLLKHKWITQIDDNKVSQRKLEGFRYNLAAYKKCSEFQASIMNLISGLLVNDEETYEIEQTFLKLNRKGDGKLSREEFVEGMTKVIGPFGTNAAKFGDHGKPDWNKYFDFLDTDNTGALDFHEFKTGCYNRQKALNDENLDKIFDILDHRKSGILSENTL